MCPICCLARVIGLSISGEAGACRGDADAAVSLYSGPMAVISALRGSGK